MADTLAEIYRNTLTSSDFDSNGEATIFTTNSSTSHVIKNIQVSDTDTQIPVNGTLKVNDFDVVALTGNSSGSEIIAPSSTVKVKATGLPINYVDYEIAMRTTGTNYITHTIATASGVTALTNIYDATNTIPFSFTGNEDRVIFAPNLGPNNYVFIFLSNRNNNQNGYLYDTSGNVVWSNTDSYAPKWFDGKLYAYWFNDSGTSGIDRVDCYTGTVTRLIDSNMANAYTYGRMYGYEDEYLWYWSRYDSGNIKVYSFATGLETDWADDHAQNRLDQADKNYFAVKRSNGTYRHVVMDQVSSFLFWDWDTTTYLTGGVSTTTVTLTGNAEQMYNRYDNCAVIGSRVYYVNKNFNVAFVDFETDTPTKGVVGTATLGSNHSFHLQQVERTPDSSTISGRSGYPNPSLKLRVTGITST